MPKLKIVYEREGCIGAAACAAIDPENFVMNDDGKADLTKAVKRPDGKWEKIVEVPTQSDAEKIIDAARGCPVDVIEIFDDKNKDKRIAP